MDTPASYAATEANSKGRRYQEPPPHPYRTEFQRDRDRIVHSKAFRRLEYKTQVFVNHEGDLFRTRLTHSLEVAQISRSICRCLRLNEDLAEAIALAHDLGHTPFGHAGQEALNHCMTPYGGFEHNLQSLRVVDELEQCYPGFDGLNLTFETREGVLKRCAPEQAVQLGELGKRFLESLQPCLEAQVVNLADEIAYNNHDIDDGLRAGLIDVQSLQSQALFSEHHHTVTQYWPTAGPDQRNHETIRRMINTLVVDLIETSKKNLETAQLEDIEAVRASPAPMIAFSRQMTSLQLELKRFLHKNLYRHHRVARMSMKAKNIVQALFHAYHQQTDLLPFDVRRRRWRLQAHMPLAFAKARVAADYIAGMTDRFAIAEHQRLFDPAALP